MGFSGQIKEYFWLFKKPDYLFLVNREGGWITPQRYVNRCRVISSDQRRNGSWNLRRSLSSCPLLFKSRVNFLSTTGEQNQRVENGQSAIQKFHQHCPSWLLFYRFQSSKNLLVTVLDFGLGEKRGGKPYLVASIRAVLDAVSKITSENLRSVLTKAA